MTESHNNVINEQPVSSMVPQENNVYENEIDLMGYILVLWKYKWLILLASILPTLIVGLVLYYSPRNYRVTYVYDMGDYERDEISNWVLTERKYRVLLSKFYGGKNLNKIASRLLERSLVDYANQIKNGGESVRALIKLEPSPVFIDTSETKMTDPEQLKNIRQLTALTLSLTITGNSKNNIPKISAVVRDNFEKVVPLYIIQESLSSDIREYKTKMSDLEENKFDQEIELQKKKAILVKMKKISSTKSDAGKTSISLQFDIGGEVQYLPIEYQIQAIESKLLHLEEEIKESHVRYDYHKVLLAVNKNLLADLKDKTDSGYTIQEFLAFLAALSDSSENTVSKSFLNLFTRKIENRISISSPVAEEPNIYPVTRGTVRKSGVVFVIALLLSMFAAFLSEGLKKSHAQAS